MFVSYFVAHGVLFYKISKKEPVLNPVENWYDKTKLFWEDTWFGVKMQSFVFNLNIVWFNEHPIYVHVHP